MSKEIPLSWVLTRSYQPGGSRAVGSLARSRLRQLLLVSAGRAPPSLYRLCASCFRSVVRLEC